MSGRGHYLKRNASNELPSRIVCVDTEARITPTGSGERHTLRLGACYYLKRRESNWEEMPFTFRTKDQFWEYLDGLLLNGTALYIIGHNMPYDYALLDLDHWISSREFVLDQFVINQSFIIKAHKGQCSIKIIDSMNWFKAPLRRLGEVFGVAKGEVEDFKKISDDELLPYCLNDAYIVRTIVLNYIDFINNHDLGNFAMTAASQAFNAYRHRFMPPRSILIHGEPGIYGLEQATYRGGRCDIFKQGHYENIVKLDINSMYPFVMHNRSYPVRPVSRGPVEGLSVQDVKQVLEQGYYVIGEFDIELNEPFLAVKRSKLIFPIGRLVHVPMTSPEIEYLLDGGGELLQIHKAMIYEQEVIFKDYVDYFYRIKSEAKNAIMKEFAKLFLNSLYGKFGQREYGEIMPDSSPEHEIICQANGIGAYWVNDGAQHYKVMKIGENYYRIDPPTGNPGHQSSPVISSAVTSYARLYLWQLIKLCGLDNVYYCDTDSIFTNKTGYERLDALGYIDNRQLGKLKVEGLGSVNLRGPKDYDWIDDKDHRVKRTIKGVPVNSKDLGEGNFLYRQWDTGLLRYSTGSSAEVILRDQVKHLTRFYDKGMIDDHGNVKPFELDELTNGPFKLPSPPREKEVYSEPKLRRRMPWPAEHKKVCRELSSQYSIPVLECSHIINKLKLIGIDYDQFDWSMIEGADLSYQERLGKIEAMLGRSLPASGRQGRQLAIDVLAGGDPYEAAQLAKELYQEIKNEQ